MNLFDKIKTEIETEEEMNEFLNLLVNFLNNLEQFIHKYKTKEYSDRMKSRIVEIGYGERILIIESNLKTISRLMKN